MIFLKANGTLMNRKTKKMDEHAYPLNFQLLFDLMLGPKFEILNIFIIVQFSHDDRYFL